MNDLEITVTADTEEAVASIERVTQAVRELEDSIESLEQSQITVDLDMNNSNTVSSSDFTGGPV